jgi:NAD(P)H-flavin reductase
VGAAPVAPDVMGLSLVIRGDRRIRYEAGQYINIVLEDGQRRAYSFTAPSGEADRIELHIRRIPGGLFTTRVFESLRVGDELRFEGPLGSFVLRDARDTRPMIFVAGATGFAPVKSLLEQAFHDGIKRPLHFYWGVRHVQDFYQFDLPQQWAREHAIFGFVPVVSEPAPGDGWTGRIGLVHEAILHDFPTCRGLVYACGSVKMVEAARPAFIAHGLNEDACMSDAFTPAVGGARSRTALDTRRADALAILMWINRRTPRSQNRGTRDARFGHRAHGQWLRRPEISFGAAALQRLAALRAKASGDRLPVAAPGRNDMVFRFWRSVRGVPRRRSVRSSCSRCHRPGRKK